MPSALQSQILQGSDHEKVDDFRKCVTWLTEKVFGNYVSMGPSTWEHVPHLIDMDRNG